MGRPFRVSLHGLEVVSPLSLATNDTTNAWLGVAGATGFQNYWILHSSGTYAEVTYGSLDYVRTSAITVPAGETLTFTVQAMLTAGQATNTSVFFAIGTTVVGQTTITGSVGAWQTLSLAYTAPAGSSAALTILVGGGIAAYTPAVPAQTAGIVRFRNANITLSGSRLEYDSDFRVVGDVIATSFVTSSDVAIKENIEDVDTADAMAMLDAVSARTYQRTDIPGDRLGFIANEVQALTPPEWGNLVSIQNGLLALDYSRFTPILWQICRNQEERLRALESA